MSLSMYKIELGRNACLHDEHEKLMHWLISALTTGFERSGSLEMVGKLTGPSPTNKLHQRQFEI
eukprot:229373-Prorocentrum_lima.AAC.1